MAEELSVTGLSLNPARPAPLPHTPVGAWQQRLRQNPSTLRVHIMGMGGAGMGPIARVLLQLGVNVSGSDRAASSGLQALGELGATVFTTQTEANLLEMAPDARPHLVLISSAVAPENPERAAAARLGLPVVKRSDFLPQLLADRKTLAVAGSHGKTTTTGMIAHILHHAGLQPGYIIGADVPGLGNAAAGTSPYFVIEADEYDHMFLGLFPTVAVVTNVEWDHPDCFPSQDAFFAAFRGFLGQVRAGGHIISCHDDAGAESLRASLAASLTHASGGQNVQWQTYGLTEQADTHIAGDHQRQTLADAAEYPVVANGEALGNLSLRVPGLHNVRNALAALSATRLCGVPSTVALAALTTFQGSRRRFERVGECRGVTVIDDYGHHPTEVAATLAAARSRFPDRVIHAVFQPHTYSRTRLLFREMGDALSLADHALVTDIYAAREQDDGSIHAQAIVQTATHPRMLYSGNLEQTTRILQESVGPGDVVITLSAGDGNRVGRDLLIYLAASAPEKGRAGS